MPNHLTPEELAAEHGLEREEVIRFCVEHDVVTYDSAPHSFFDRKQEEFADASDDAWRRVLAFVERYA